MLNSSSRQLVKATAPILREHGETLTRHFYARMFEHNPELKQVFNQGQQQAGQQQKALALAVLAYAEQIDDPSVLLPVLTMVANKHVSLGIRAEHYAIVGKHLLASISEVLGAAASVELLNAWAEAYALLADTLIELETQYYKNMVAQDAGWSGWRGFQVSRKQAESAEITSFYLRPADGGKVPNYLPGQYISLRVMVPQLGYMQARQYSLSNAPGGELLRISVKREAAQEGKPAGMVSNFLHQHLQEGDVLDVAPPAGDFFLRTERDNPVVLLSAGAGLTPLLAMLEHVLVHTPDRQVRFAHACRDGEVHAFGTHLAQLKARHSQLKCMVFYETPKLGDCLGQDYDQSGRMDLSPIADSFVLATADYYLCGPVPFIQEQKRCLLALGVAASAIHLELFGSGGFAQ